MDGLEWRDGSTYWHLAGLDMVGEPFQGVAEVVGVGLGQQGELVEEVEDLEGEGRPGHVDGGGPELGFEELVELGKVLAKNILSQLEKPEDVKNHDSAVCRSVSRILDRAKVIVQA